MDTVRVGLLLLSLGEVQDTPKRRQPIISVMYCFMNSIFLNMLEGKDTHFFLCVENERMFSVK